MNMARKSNPELLQTAVTGNQFYKSRLETSKNFNKDSYDQLMIRVPKGWKEQLQEYVNTTMNEAGELKYQSKGKGSVNKLINELIMRETGWSEE